MAKMNKGGALKTMGKTAPPAVDASFTMKGGKVNADAVRGSVAPSQKVLGPRNA